VQDAFDPNATLVDDKEDQLRSAHGAAGAWA
jgi:hypothetical protein